MAAQTADPGAFLLDSRFRHLLKPDQRTLAEALEPVVALLEKTGDEKGAYRPVADLLRRLGRSG